MKKMIIACSCLLALASCNVKNSDEYKRLQAEKDSIAQQNSSANAELNEMIGLINEVEENFNQIKEAEKYLTIESNGKGEISTDKKTAIRDNFQMINDILVKNRADIEKLNQRLKGNSKELAGLKGTIERLNNELEQRASAITELQESLRKRDVQIAQLETDVTNLTQNVDMLADQSAVQADVISAQDKALNAAYYMFGTSKELKEAKVISGGFLSSPKILKEGIEKSKFIQIDIRQTHTIPVYAKKAKLLSDHPKDSYVFEIDGTDNIVLRITDYKRFWSLGKFLIIEVN